jgi:hypothetical protein
VNNSSERTQEIKTSSKSQQFIAKDLKNSDMDEISKHELKIIMIRMINEMKKDMNKHLNEFKDNTNKQLNKLKKLNEMKTMQNMR